MLRSWRIPSVCAWPGTIEKLKYPSCRQHEASWHLRLSRLRSSRYRPSRGSHLPFYPGKLWDIRVAPVRSNDHMRHLVEQPIYGPIPLQEGDRVPYC